MKSRPPYPHDAHTRRARPAPLRRHGFTLIELAVVFTIVAVLVSGTLATSSLIRTANVQNVGKEIGDLQRAMDTYQEYYGSLPGDTPDATERFRCGGCNGNGNGKVDEDERGLFFEHLSRAHLLKSTLTASSLGGGRLYPESSAARNAIIDVEVRVPDRLVAVIRNDPNANVGPLSPSEAQSVDRRIDDGNAQNGRLVVEAVPGATNADCKNGADFAADRTAARCNLAYVLLGRDFSNAVDPTHEYQWNVEPAAATTPVGVWKVGGLPFNPAVSADVERGWGDCSQSCGGGVQSRAISCTPGTADIAVSVTCTNITDSTSATETLCGDPKPGTTRRFSGCNMTPPPAQRVCNDTVCPNGWAAQPWGNCVDSGGNALTSGEYEIGNWGSCSADCDSGNQARKVTCRPRTGVRSRAVTCATPPCDGPKPATTENCSKSTCGTPPATSRACNDQSCASGWRTTAWSDCKPAPSWNQTNWSVCNSACGGPATQIRSVSCTGGGVRTRGVSCLTGSCTGAAPVSSESCDYSCQGGRPPDIRVCYGGNNWGDMYNSSTQIFRAVDDSTGWIGCLSE